MANDAVLGVTIKAIGDFSDVVSNVGSVQKALAKLKLPDKLGDNLNKNLTAFYKEYDKYQKKIAEGIHTQGDQNTVNKSLNSMLNSYEKIISEFSKLSKQDFKDIFNLDDGAFASVQKRIKDIQTEIKKIKIDPKQLFGPMDKITKLTNAKAVSGGGKGVDKIRAGIDANDFSIMKQGLIELEAYYERFSSKMGETKRLAIADEIKKLKAPIEDAINASDRLEKEAKELDKQFNDIGSGASRELGDVTTALDKTKVGAENVVAELKRIHSEEFSFNREAQNIDRQIQSYFGLSQMIRKVGDIARNAFATVKDLDKAMTETAVVTNFDVGDMWDMLPTYTAQANQLGSTIRDVYEAATLYYQQGLNTNQAMGLANETLKMARIAGLDAKDATDMMTAALRGFNMEVNQMSAQKINDVYSELAAITASDTKEIGSAMERTASIANSANMEFETTSAFLAQMIETTREAPENLGTAMKTIVARFQEMKQDPTKLVDSEGVAMDVNKVDKALKTIGVSLTNTKGEFRDLDDVFLDISAKWDSLSQGQQRYIATIAAGSRQQSRFIAMMSNYERTMELVDAANNSAGASQRQFEKTLDSMEAKLNKLKNAWDQFTMGLMNNQILKTSVDLLTGAFTIVNKLIDTLGSIPTKPFEGITKSALTLITTLGMLQLGKKGSRGLVMGAASWWQKGKIGADGNPMDGGFLKGFSQGWGSPKNTSILTKQSKYGDVIKADIISAKIPQTIQGEFVKGKALATAAFNTGTKLIAVDNFISSAELSADAKAKAEEWWAYYRARIEQGKDTFDDGLSYFNSKMAWEKVPLTVNPDEIQQSSQKIQQLGNEFTGLGSRITKAGASLQAFGATMQGTPFEPFGNALIRIGNLLVNTGDLAISAGKKLKTAWKAAQNAKKDGATNAGAIGAFFKSLTKIPAQALIILAVVAAMGVLIHHVATQGKRDLEAAENAAAAASEAYDSAKQEASELADAIDKIHEADSAFDGLVVGTAAFNEQLVTANDQIMELIKKYPMLNDYLTTDKNGVMHISEEGLTAAKEYQKQRQANASALNILQTNDLRAEETKQQIEALRKKDKGASEYSADKQQNKDEIELLEKRIKAEDQAAKLSAVNTALVGKEISNREKVSTILADQYDMRKSMVQLEGDKHDRRQQYAEFYGYNYNRSTKKMTDVEGNEIDFDDKVIEDALKDITILADFEVDAGAVDTAIASIDKKFSKQFSGDNSFFSDILSDNIETNEDLLRNILQNPDKLENAVSELSEKEIAAVLGVSADTVAEAPDKYKDELTDKLADKAKNIAESQADAWGELGAMIAQSEGKNADAILQEGTSAINVIQRQLTDFTAQQRDLMVSIGKSLESGAGVESMKTFISGATDIYRSNSQSMIDEFNGLVENVNWDSPIARLKAYGELAKSNTAEIKKMGQELLNSTDSANLLGEAFEEFYNSNDWAELSENMDNFVDASGKLNAAAIEDMAKQCGSLNNLLDTGAISAGGVAAAINALGSDGELTLLDLNSSVLKLLTDFNQLEDAISSAHRSIENFDWGIDTGEAEDFAKESAEKWKELYDNGEYGNPQLEAYAKYILGEENYIKMLNKNHGDLEETMDKVAKYVNRYADGFDSAWERIAGGSWQGEKIQKKLAKAGLDDKGIKMFTEGDHIVWEPGTATTDELIKWLQEVEGVSEEWAKVMLEDWENYSPNFRAERQKNDFEAGLRDGSYIDEHKNANGGVTITASELETIAAATGKESEEVKTAIEEASGKEVDVIDNLGDNLDNYNKLNQDYNKAITGSQDKSWIEPLTKVVDDKKQVDASQAITQAIGDGFKQDQAERMAYDELSKAVAEGTDVWYKDKLLTPEDLASFDNFKTAIQEFEDNSQWIQVGEAIAEGVVSYLEGKNKPEENNSNSSTSDTDSNDTTNKSNKQRKTATIPGVNDQDQPNRQKAKWENYVPGWMSTWFKKIGQDYQNPHNQTSSTQESTEQPLQKLFSGFVKLLTTESAHAQEGRDQKITAGLQQSQQQSQSAATETSNAADNLTDSATEASSSLQQAATSLEGSATSLNSAAASLTINNPNNNGGLKSGTVPGVPQPAQPNQSSVSGTVTVDGTSALETLTAIYDKATETAAKINEGASFAINVSGDKKLNDAADSASKISNSTGDKSFSVKATASGTDDTNALTNAVKDFSKLNSKTIKLKANTSGLIGTLSLTAAAKAFEKLTDHTVTLKTIKVTETHPHTGGMVKEGGGLQYKAKGGSIFKKKGTDTVPAMLTPGEYVQNRGAVQYFGVDFMRKINHKDLIGAIQSFGSAAKGRYGTVGPNGKGGLTLTGEEGFEIVWLPSENRSMIVGNGGPQMLDLPSDAVVYTHEESQDILKRQGIDAGSHSRRRRKGGSGSSGGSKKGGKGSSGSGSSKKKSSSTKNINNFSMQEVVRFNIDKKITTLTNQIEKRTKSIEKTLSKIGTTYNDIVKNTKDQITALNAVKTNNQSIYDSYKAQLEEYRKQKEIVSYTTSGGKSKNKTINVSTYVNADGSINYDAIKKLDSKALREAVFKQVSGVAKNLTDGMENAQKAIDDANQKIADLGKQMSETFYQWENELTEIYDLTQRINDETSLTSRFAAQVELEYSRLNVGFGDTAVSIENIRKSLNRNNETLKDQIANQQQLIAARERELQAALSTADEAERVQKIQNNSSMDAATKAATLEWAQGLQKGAEIGRSYVKNLFTDLDGHIEYTIDWEQFNKDRDANPMTKDTYDKVKEYLDNLNDAATEFNNSIEEQTNSIKDLYDSLRDYQDYIGDFEDTLIDGVEELNKTETENAKRLSDSISNTLKDLLDEVKRKLDERRKQEDNRKTEQDISQKQQQLAALRANTAGGNQVQIAQLEKEIADAQQSYQRTLEDQLLDRLQQQGDEAQKQRERLIELSEAQFNIAASNNKELVDLWLKDPETYRDNIYEAWMAANGYDDKGEVGQELLKESFESEFAHLVTAIEQTGFKEGIQGLQNNTSTLITLLQSLENGEIGRNDELSRGIGALEDVTKRNTESLIVAIQNIGNNETNPVKLHEQGVDAGYLRLKGVDAKDLVGSNPNSPIYNASELQKGGYSVTDLQKAGITDLKTLYDAGYTPQVLKKEGNYSATDFYKANISYANAKAAGFDDTTLKEAGYTLPSQNSTTNNLWQTIQDTFKNFSLDYTSGKVSPLGAAALAEAKKHKGAKVYIQGQDARVGASGEIYWDRKGTVRKWNPSTGQIYQFPYNQATYIKEASPKNSPYVYEEFAESLHTRKVKGYKTGGLATQTGPAWLDGTPAKPELVLNAQDTKNFIALKDVLAHAVGSTSNINNSYGGDATYEININVDHLNNDYDVDKVVERVKKKIVQDSGYRNVTQVRKFR